MAFPGGAIIGARGVAAHLCASPHLTILSQATVGQSSEGFALDRERVLGARVADCRYDQLEETATYELDLIFRGERSA